MVSLKDVHWHSTRRYQQPMHPLYIVTIQKVSGDLYPKSVSVIHVLLQSQHLASSVDATIAIGHRAK